MAVVAGLGLVALWWMKRKDSAAPGVVAGSIGSKVNQTDTLGLGLAALSGSLGLGSSLYLNSPSGSVSVNPEITAYRLEMVGQSPLIVPAAAITGNNTVQGESNPWNYFRGKIESGWKPYVVFSDGSSKPLTP